MCLSPSSPRRIASVGNKTSNPPPQRSASGQETQVLPGLKRTRGSGVALRSKGTSLQLPRSLSSLSKARYGARITGVTFAATHHFLRQVKSVLRRAYHRIFPPQVGPPRQKSKIFGIDLDETSILLILDTIPRTTDSPRGLSSFLIDPISDPLCLTAFRVPRLAQEC